MYDRNGDQEGHSRERKRRSGSREKVKGRRRRRSESEGRTSDESYSEMRSKRSHGKSTSCFDEDKERNLVCGPDEERQMSTRKTIQDYDSNDNRKNSNM